MGWVWVIFVLVSVLANFLEKMGKQAPGRSAPDRKGKADLDENWMPTEAFPGTSTEDFPPRKPKPAPVSVGNYAPAQLPDHPKQQEDLLTVEEREILLRPQRELVTEDPFFIAFREEDLIPPEDTRTEGEERESEGWSFRSAFILAQVLARPDFTSLPWRRRI
ncbi:MAG: hypothetical protein GX081_00345 [Firmicutes bacterium]|nr:hypothetical protein [Bacillota bacterium]